MNKKDQRDILEVTRRVVAVVRPDELDIISPSLLNTSKSHPSRFLGFGAEAAVVLLSPLILEFFKDVISGFAKPLGEAGSRKLLREHEASPSPPAHRAEWIDGVTNALTARLQTQHVSDSDITLIQDTLKQILVTDATLLEARNKSS